MVRHSVARRCVEGDEAIFSEFLSFLERESKKIGHSSASREALGQGCFCYNRVRRDVARAVQSGDAGAFVLSKLKDNLLMQAEPRDFVMRGRSDRFIVAGYEMAGLLRGVIETPGDELLAQAGGAVQSSLSNALALMRQTIYRVPDNGKSFASGVHNVLAQLANGFEKETRGRIPLPEPEPEPVEPKKRGLFFGLSGLGFAGSR